MRPQFKTDWFQHYPWDISSSYDHDTNQRLASENINNWNRLLKAEEIILYLRSLKIMVDDKASAHKFAYWRCWEKKRTYYVFIINTKNELLNVNKCNNRKKIGRIINRYWGFKIIVWYPQQNPLKHEQYRYYIPFMNLDISPFTGHKRITKNEIRNEPSLG